MILSLALQEEKHKNKRNAFSASPGLRTAAEYLMDIAKPEYLQLWVSEPVSDYSS